ncbi:motility associated factor glycosyltransferase family protein [Sporolituus thermophilus]|uniref:Uncharacterized conserved protein n=1 Tax=Sporolituus thermophilus DSM 23256 TaxID=1123285 RepID=A0A1G7P274_9FIRM|nr:6-hydroxymethylpterin diphosphokinase MptE-like protein [Sporolituus thermophilus]SDF79719.1 Uncharacterized conserved protein [Sporolituus thermophilus DSM 23256]
MNLFDKNLQILESRGIHLLDLDRQLNETVLTYVGTDDEGVKWFWDHQKNPVSISGKIDSSSLPDKNLKQIIFFFGLASLKEIVDVASHAHPESLFVLIEPNLSLLQYALNNEDFAELDNLNYVVFAAEPAKIINFVEMLASSKIFLLMRRPFFYFNSFYRQRDLNLVKEYIVEIRQAISHKYFKIGNSIHDSLIGLINNMQNLASLRLSPDVAVLKNSLKGCPAFIVAAGPSLDKNINYLKEIGNQGLIIAVDTIAEKLVNNGIYPHVISSVERIKVWEYFFQDKPPYYSQSYLVAPPLVQPELINAFAGRVILPMRQSVNEYRWLSKVLGLSDDSAIWMGASCAHIAMGFALHLGASPIVLVGQDLAYGRDMSKTHAAGTAYDDKPMPEQKVITTVEGYYGEEVKTNKIWLDFKLMFEKIIELTKVDVINATEGGARIKGTVQEPLNEVIDRYCTRAIDVFSVFENAPKYRIDWDNVCKYMNEYIQHLENLSDESTQHLKKLKDIQGQWDFYVKKYGVNHIYDTMQKTDIYYRCIPEDLLLYHNLQGPLVNISQKFYLIPDDGSLESLKENLRIQIEFCEMFSATTWLIAQVIQENYPWDLC